MSDRIWVDQDECRLFVLNLETGLPKVYGDPRGLMTVLANSPVSTAPSQTTGQTAAAAVAASPTNPVLATLGLSATASNSTPQQQPCTAESASKDELAEAVAATVRGQPPSVAKVGMAILIFLRGCSNFCIAFSAEHCEHNTNGNGDIFTPDRCYTSNGIWLVLLSLALPPLTHLGLWRKRFELLVCANNRRDFLLSIM